MRGDDVLSITRVGHAVRAGRQTVVVVVRAAEILHDGRLRNDRGALGRVLPGQLDRDRQGHAAIGHVRTGRELVTGRGGERGGEGAGSTGGTRGGHASATGGLRGA